MPNLWNPDAVDAYLKIQAKDDPKLADLLTLALKRSLIKRPKNMEPLKTLPENAPQWLQKKWGREKFVSFAPHKDAALDGKVKHIADWIGGALKEQSKDSRDPGSDWLKDIDEKGRPKKLLKLGSLEHATAEADKAMKRGAMKQKQKYRDRAVAVEQDPHLEIVKRFEQNKYFIVRLKDAEALDIETAEMGHCVGEGSYDADVESGEIIIYSLRDAGNKPHATLEVDVKNNTLMQCKGKENEPPILRYFPYIQEFVKENKFDIEEDVSNTGLVKNKGEYYHIENLPKNLTLKGDLNLTEMAAITLPQGLVVKGVLSLTTDYILNSSLASHVQAGRLEFKDVDLSKADKYYPLPENAIFEGYLNLNADFYSPEDGNEIDAEEIQYYREENNDDLPTWVCYEFRKITEEWEKDGVEHRTGKPSYIITNTETNIILHEQWKQDGKYYCMAQPSDVQRYDDGQLKSAVYYNDNENWYSRTVSYDEETGIPYNEEYQNKSGYPDRKDGPARIERDKVTGTVNKLSWISEGYLDRLNAPAILNFNPVTNRLTLPKWYKNGVSYFCPVCDREVWHAKQAIKDLEMFKILAAPPDRNVGKPVDLIFA